MSSCTNCIVCGESLTLDKEISCDLCKCLHSTCSSLSLLKIRRIKAKDPDLPGSSIAATSGVEAVFASVRFNLKNLKQKKTDFTLYLE